MFGTGKGHASDESSAAPEGLQLIHTLGGHGGYIGRVAWSPDGKALASPSTNGTIRLWNTADGALIKVIRGSERCVNSIAWSPKGDIPSRQPAGCS